MVLLSRSGFIESFGFIECSSVQAPEKFAAAATRNPLCNIPLLFGTSDIPDWCFTEVFGSERRPAFTESPFAEHLDLFYSKSPIAHVSKVIQC